MDPAAAEMMEITENLIRFDLSPAERIAHTARWKTLYETAHPETKHGATGKGRGKRSQNEISNAPAAAAEHIAKNTGRGKSSVSRDTTISKKLGDELVNRIKGTSLDKDAEMLALCELPPEVVEVIVAKAQAGKKVSAKERLAEWKTETALRARAESLGFRLLTRGKKFRLMNKDLGADFFDCPSLDAIGDRLDKIATRPALITKGANSEAPVTGSAERSIDDVKAAGAALADEVVEAEVPAADLGEQTTAQTPPTEPPTDRSLAEKLHYHLNEVWALCEDESNWLALSPARQPELRGAMTKLGYLREVLPRLAKARLQ